MTLKMKPGTLLWIFFGMFGGGGLLFMVIGIAVYLSDQKFYEEATPAEAVITDFVRDRADDSSSTIVSFTANGSQRIARLGYYSSGMSIGERITIYYRPQNPLDIRYKGASKFVLYIFCGIGLPFFIVGVVGIVRMAGGRSRARRLKEHGLRIRAEITGVDYNTMVSMNGRHPLVITCKAKAPDGTTRTFRSGNLWNCSEDDIVLHSQVDVFVDERRPKSYYVDVGE